MGIFGWSLPAGCGTLPTEEEYGCEICGKDVDSCICPECPECGDVGDPHCYEHHGLVRTKEQTKSLAVAEAAWQQANEEEVFGDPGSILEDM